MKKIIFLPGFTGGKRDIFVAKSILNNFELIYFNYDTSFRQPLEEISNELDIFINSLKLEKNEKVGLIGVSAGGIIASYYSKFNRNPNIEKFVTICSPLKGTFFVSLFPASLKGLKQMRLNSTFLRKLNQKKSKIQEQNYWSYFDFLVPGKSGKGNHGKYTFFFFHPLIQWWPPIYFKIKGFFI